MQRITISIDDDLLEVIDSLSTRRGYTSRSEAIRDFVREAMTREQAVSTDETPCVATLSYVYEHQTRDLARRLTSAQHEYRKLSVSTLHVHLDGGNCLEIAVLKGSVEAVRSFADGVTTQRGVRLGNLHVIPIEHELDDGAGPDKNPHG